MKEQPKTCKFCKFLACLPFSDSYFCENEYSDFGGIECDPDNDTCEDFEEEGD